MIILTGGAGFIGSAMLWHLNQQGRKDIIVVDELESQGKWKNLVKYQFENFIHKNEFLGWLAGTEEKIEAVIHMGASSATDVIDADFLMANNYHYTRSLWDFCAKQRVPFIYASSAATYGDGELGFSDEPSTFETLRPLNPYGYSKAVFDKWAIQQKLQPPFWAGLKFFNVYGPNEYHKGSQSSVIPKFVDQIRASGSITLFRSDKDGVQDGHQQRDFVYVKDCVKVMGALLDDNTAKSGVYNLGTGEARTFVDVAQLVFKGMGVDEVKIDWMETPIGLREHYQYFTRAELSNLREKANYKHHITTIDSGIIDYVKNYLETYDPYL